MSKKRLWRILGVSVLAVICATVFYLRTYPIKVNLVTLDWQIIREAKFENESAPDVKFLGTGVTIDRKEWYLISLNGKFGYASL